MRLINVFFLQILFTSTISAQKGVIQGYVGDEQSYSPLPGVTISLPDNSLGDNSDNFGLFRIGGVTPGHYELLVSHIGYTTKKIFVDLEENKIATLRVNMESSNLNISVDTKIESE